MRFPAQRFNHIPDECSGIATSGAAGADPGPAPLTSQLNPRLREISETHQKQQLGSDSRDVFPALVNTRPVIPISSIGFPEILTPDC